MNKSLRLRLFHFCLIMAVIICGSPLSASAMDSFPEDDDYPGQSRRPGMSCFYLNPEDDDEGCETEKGSRWSDAAVEYDMPIRRKDKRIPKIAKVAAGTAGVIGLGAASSRLHRAYAVSQAEHDQAEFCRLWNKQMRTLTPKQRKEIVKDLSAEYTSNLNQDYLYPEEASIKLADEAQENMERELVKPTGLGINYWKDYWRKRQERNALQERFNKVRGGTVNTK